jgi:hypothetical protein
MAGARGGTKQLTSQWTGSRETDRSLGQDTAPKDTLPHDLLSPATILHLLKFPELPKITPPAGDQAFNS